MLKCIILAYFSKTFTNNALIFRTFGRKTQFVENFEKNFEIFQQISYENCEKCIILAYFSKTFTNHALIFRTFGRKTQFVWKFWETLKIFDKNSIEKLNF